MDPFIAEKLVRFRQAELRADAERVALRAAMTRKASPSEHQTLIGMAAALVPRVASIGLRSIPWVAMRAMTKSNQG